MSEINVGASDSVAFDICSIAVGTNESGATPPTVGRRLDVLFGINNDNDGF